MTLWSCNRRSDIPTIGVSNPQNPNQEPGPKFAAKLRYSQTPTVANSSKKSAWSSRSAGKVRLASIAERAPVATVARSVEWQADCIQKVPSSTSAMVPFRASCTCEERVAACQPDWDCGLRACSLALPLERSLPLRAYMRWTLCEPPSLAKDLVTDTAVKHGRAERQEAGLGPNA